MRNNLRYDRVGIHSLKQMVELHQISELLEKGWVGPNLNHYTEDRSSSPCQLHQPCHHTPASTLLQSAHTSSGSPPLLRTLHKNVN